MLIKKPVIRDVHKFFSANSVKFNANIVLAQRRQFDKHEKELAAMPAKKKYIAVLSMVVFENPKKGIVYFKLA